MIWCWGWPLVGVLVWLSPAPAPANAAQLPHYTTTDRNHGGNGGGGVHLSGKPCKVGRRSGTCVWVQECLRQRGQHIGVCVDGFMFGSCCAIEDQDLAEASASTQGTTIYRPTFTTPYKSSTQRPDSSQTQTQQSKPHRPQTQRPSFMTKPIDSSISNSYKPPVISSDLNPSDSSNNVDKPMTYSSQLGSKPSRPNNYNIVLNDYNAKPLRPSSGAEQRPLAAPGETSPSNKISSSPSIVVGSGAAPQRGTARPIASITILEEDDAQNSISSVHWAGRPGGGGGANTLHWHATTEPGFITRPRPASTWNKPSTGKPKPTKKFTTTTSKTPTTKPAPHQKPLPSKPLYYKPVKTSTKSPVGMSEMEGEQPSPSGGGAPSTSTRAPVTTTAATRKIECGVPALFSRPETRIVGGKDAPFGRWPWQVSVRRTSFFGFSSTHRCGGAVLNENWVATAGHCVDDLLTSQIRIRVGEYDFSNVQEDHPYVERGVARKAVHPKYNFFTYEYDLALVRLEQALAFAPHISPICLPATDDLLVGENATVTGWGRLSEGGTLPSILQEVQVPIVSNDRCKSMFLRAGRHEFIPDIFLCAGHERGGQDSCQGDSGGPLQVKGRDGRYFLAGIISWGIGCAEANLPGVCTRISKFVPWILETVT